MEVIGPLHGPAAFTRGMKSPLHSLYMRVGGPQSRFGSFEDERNLLLRPGFNTQMRLPARTLIIRPTELFRLPHPKCNYIIILYIFALFF